MSIQPTPVSPVPRRLLARVRDVMAGPGTAEVRLGRVVAVIAADMVAEVCSVYVRRAGDVLELFATQGLKPEAVHNTRLRVGEGLVGDIAAHARPTALADAQRHPNFAYRPETGEEIYHSLMGVPVLRGGRVIGVLVVQNRTRRHYTDEEVETLQTVAMVLAELVAGGDLIPRDELRPADGIATRPQRLEGIRLTPGIGIGTAVLHQPRVALTRLVAEDVRVEHARLRRAVAEMHGALDAMLKSEELATGEHRDILDAYRMFAEDAGWIARIDEAIDGGLTAEAAVQKVHNAIRARMGEVADPYLRERVHDLDDLANRLLAHLLGVHGEAAERTLPEDVVLVARAMGPAQLLDYDRDRLRAVVLEEGSPSSHVAIVARALDVPVIGGVHDALMRIEDGDALIVDGDNAQVFVRPAEDVQQAYFENQRLRADRRAEYAALRDLPAVTLDGERICLNINVGLLIDLQHLEATQADGIGLYRTEIPFMVRQRFPGVDEQRRLYARVLDEAGDRPVVFRTLDVGGDKVLPYWSGGEEENPAMGWRAIRVSLDRPAMLRQQMRALIRAAAGREISVMFPMVAEVAEFRAARVLVEAELERERRRGAIIPRNMSLGVMLEVPALAWQLDALLGEVDFVSVGSNDLLQFLFASDRGNPRLAERYDPLSPAALALLGEIVEKCRRAGVPVGLCGEMATRPLEAMALIGLGFRDLSVAPPGFGPVKAMVRSLNVGELTRYMNSLRGSDLRSLRDRLRAFARDHAVKIVE